VLCVFICAFWFVYVSPSFYVSLGSWVMSLTVFGTSVTNFNEPPWALAVSTIAWVRLAPSLLGRCKQKQRGLRRLLCRWPSITEWKVHITAHGSRLRNDLYCVEWDVKLYCTIPGTCADGRKGIQPDMLVILIWLELCTNVTTATSIISCCSTIKNSSTYQLIRAVH